MPQPLMIFRLGHEQIACECCRMRISQVIQTVANRTATDRLYNRCPRDDAKSRDPSERIQFGFA
jgi:hypothetical protein